MNFHHSRERVLSIKTSIVAAATCALALLALDRGAWAQAAEEKPEFPPFETVTKDAKKLSDGFMDLHHNTKTDELFLTVPKGYLGKEFLLAISMSAGGPMTGFQWGTTLLKWEEQGKNLILIQPEVRHLRKDSTVKSAIERTYTDTILRVLPIKTKTAKGDLVVEFSGLLKSDLGGFATVLGGAIKGELSTYSSIKNFKNNTEVQVKMAAMGGPTGNWGAVHYSFSSLPNGDYKPRIADDRVGYFQTVMRDWSTKHSEDTSFVRYVNRWHVKKKDASLDLSPPEEPIVFYIEKTVPVPFRRYVKDGILEWNKAFEKCGIIDAIVVRQQDDNQFADLDPEDVRYNFFRWIVSGRAFAMGPSRVNPRNGQILDADIIMDDSFVRYFVEDYLINSGTGLTPYNEYDPKLAAFFAKNPEWRLESREGQLISERDLAWMRRAELPMPSGADTFGLANPLCSSEFHPCQAAEGMMHQINLVRAELAAKGKHELPLEFVGQLLREVVMHEVGHTLGLRHNFRASAWKSMADISGNSDPTVPTAASVMDYNGAIFTPEDIEQGDYVTRTIGPYDEWAIAYGYSSVAEPHKNEEELLASLTSRSGETALAFATDEDTSVLGPDPHINRYDMSSNNIDFARQQARLSRQLLEDIEGWAVKDGEAWYKLRRAFNMLVGEIGRGSLFVGRYVGGQYISRAHKGDKADGEAVVAQPIMLVPAARQREAMAYLSESVWSAKTWEFSPELLARLAAGRYGHWDSDQFDANLDFDLSARISSLQNNSLFLVLNPATLSRLYDSRTLAAKDEDVYSITEHFEKLDDAIWGELDVEPSKEGKKDGGEYIPASRRSLQRAYLRGMTNLVLGKPGANVPEDVNSLARLTLADLSARIEKRLDGKVGEKIDALSRAHLFDSGERIKQILDASYQLER